MQVYYSPDGTREVTVSADGNETAYLYDIDPNDMSPFAPVYLCSGVNDVQFQTDDQGNLTVTAVLDDGVYCVFDSAGNPQAEVVYSPDQTRKVEISGTNQDAYLYDIDPNDQAPFDPVYLNSGASEVQFQADANGNVVVVVLNADGSATTYDAYGNNIGNQPAPQSNVDQSNNASTLSVGKSLEKSPLLGTLKTGNINW
jgi:hypothetical protein